MRFVLTVSLLALVVNPLRAQTETLVGEDVTHGGFGGLTYQVSTVLGEAAYLQGIRGGWILNLTRSHAVSLGLASYDLENDVVVEGAGSSDSAPPHLGFDVDGLEIEYVNRSYRVIHLSVPILIGGGQISYERTDDDERTDPFFVMHAGLLAELNVAPWFRIQAGGAYRWTSGAALVGVADEDLRGFGGLITLKFGGFGLSGDS